MHKSEHLAQFYETDAFFLASIADAMGPRLRAGDGLIVVGTKAHRDGIEGLLRNSGLNLSVAIGSGQYVALDATETLSKFMGRRLPSRQAFFDVVGGEIERAFLRSGNLLVVAETVALLWQEQNYEAVIGLEQLWNDLQRVRPFTLLCGYPIDQVGGATRIKPFTSVCAAHSRIIPAESYMAPGGISIVDNSHIDISTEESATLMKDEFLASLSHELRTPLNAIMGWSHMLLSGKLDQTTTVAGLKIIDQNARSQAQLIEEIMDVSRAIIGELRLNRTTVEMGEVITATSSRAKNQRLPYDDRNSLTSMLYLLSLL